MFLIIFFGFIRAQVVGWPPVRSYRKNIMAVQSEKATKEDGEKSGNGTAGAAFVKVSMDGAPYLRKVDLKMYNSYKELSTALEKMFSSFTIGKLPIHWKLININYKNFTSFLACIHLIIVYMQREREKERKARILTICAPPLAM